MKDSEPDNVSDTQTELVRQFMYCGPNIPSLGLFSYQVYLGEFPVSVKNAIERIPEIEKLICSVNEADEFRAKIKRKGTAEHLYYERVKGKVIK